MSATTDPTTYSPRWNPALRLRCMECGEMYPPGAEFRGCSRCAVEPAAPLEPVYSDDAPADMTIAEAGRYLRSARMPFAIEHFVTLGRVRTTPLVPMGRGEDLWVKNEMANPTWSHKDRAHEISIAAAALLGGVGVVAASTGNHGAAAAAHASRAGLPSIVFCHRGASETAITMIKGYGGVAAQLDADEERDAIAELVDAGWYPATTMDPAVSIRSNPYGAEGYKIISYEIAEELGRMPGTVIVPSASGDTLYGIMKGFSELSELTGLTMPTVVAVQPTGAAPLVAGLRSGVPVRIERPRSIALSIADPLSGRHALAALQAWDGAAIAVSDEEIIESVIALARQGLLAEPSSAASHAGYRRMLAERDAAFEGAIVLLVTNAGPKWPAELSAIFTAPTFRTWPEARSAVEDAEEALGV